MYIYIYSQIIKCLRDNFRDFKILQFSRKQ